MSTTTTSPPPIIVETDLKFYLSGGYFNSDPNASLGGEISSFALVSGSLDGLFDRIDTNEAEKGDVEYRCVYLRNTNQTRKLLGTKIWIETGTKSPDTAIAISIGSAGMNGTEPMIPTESIEPPMNFFEIPLQAPEEPNIGDLFPGDSIGLWIRWFVNTGTQSIPDDVAIIRIDGEREPETLNQIPDPTDPPPIECPLGQRYDPISGTCVVDTTIIICPNGYVYNTTTQRCVPPATPPPTTPTWKFAAGGDFSCSSDNTASMNSMKTRLNTTAAEPNDISIFLALGDLSYNDGDQSCWINSTKVLGAMFPNHIAPVIGNHDDIEDGMAEDRASIINTYPMMSSEGWYTFTRRNIQFIMMDTQKTYTAGSAQHTFAVESLQAAAGDPAIKWIIVCYHKPSFTTGTNYGPLTDFRLLYHPLFDEYKVDIIFSGHNHIYFRSKPVRYNTGSPSNPIIASTQTNGNYINIDGRIFNTTGTGGRTSDHIFDGNAESYVGHRSLPPPYGVTFCTLQENGTQLACEFVSNTGQVLDSYTLSKPAPIEEPPPLICPEGTHYSEELGYCISSPQSCPNGQTWSEEQNMCIPITAEPPPPPPSESPGYPITNVEWYYDAVTTLNTNQTIDSGDHAADGVLLCSSASGVDSVSISNGYLLIETGGGNGRVYFDYHTRPRFAVNDQPGFNLAMTFTWVYDGQENCSVKDGNHQTSGFSLTNLVFGGFGFALHQNEIESKAEYWHNEQGDDVTSVYPRNLALVEGNEYKIFFTIRTDRVAETVVLNVWQDFDDGQGWTKIMTNRTWSNSGWDPGSVPSGDDQDEIEAGPSKIKRHHVWIRNNGGGQDMKVKDIKIGTLPYLN